MLIKGGAYLERIGRVRVVAFDKTGTLTRGVPEVVGLTPFVGISRIELVNLVAAVESRSEHPLAKAVVHAASRLVVEKSAEDPDEPIIVRNFDAVPGRGTQGALCW